MMNKLQFMPLDEKTEADVYNPETTNQQWQANALRILIPSDINTQRRESRGHEVHLSSNRAELLSLRDVIVRKVDIDAGTTEAYIMLNAESHEMGESVSGIASDKTLIIKRSKIIFDEGECTVLNFQDVSMFKQLRREQ